MRKSFFKVVMVLVVAIAAFSLWSYNQFTGDAVSERFTISLSSEVVDSDPQEFLSQELLPNIKHDLAFKFYASHLNLYSTIKPGLYEITPGMSVMRIVRVLELGEQSPINITFNNLRTLPDFAGRISGQLNVDSVELLSYLTKPQTAQQYGFTPTTIFAMFIPDTYQFYLNTTPEQFTKRMNSEYTKFWNSDRQAKAKALNLTQVEVMTLASIIYEETKQTSEMRRVAGVYANRLRIGMPLQADPTVKYAIGDFSIKRVLYKHLEFDSPYNTYKYKGLPPSPIAMPSIAAIDAALSPEQHSYLYFCARPTFDGYHNFAGTLSEHNANAKAYINELNRLKVK